VGRARRKSDDVLLLTSPVVYSGLLMLLIQSGHKTDADQHCHTSLEWNCIPLVMLMKYSPYSIEYSPCSKAKNLQTFNRT
jgi:hypothetical protein